jgi:4-hydroxy-3-polyprenylbenzoate decarboxylase
MQCSPQEISQKWTQAQVNSVPPILVESGPVHERVFYKEEGGEGLGMLPIPISTPGFDNAPYLTAPNWITKDPETGIRNVGTYRGQVKAPWRMGCNAAAPYTHIQQHWFKHKQLGTPLPAAVVIGVTPNISFASVSNVPYGKDEFAVAGGVTGEPIKLVKCKTVDLEVPANAEIVIEGEIPTDELEREGPFGEFHGYMSKEDFMFFMNIKCITCRKDPIYEAFISQFPPSESSKIRGIAKENVLFKLLKVEKGLDVTEVALHESSGSWGYCVISIKKKTNEDPQVVFNAILENTPYGKIYIIVDDDIDPRDPDSVNWALTFRMQPARDTRIEKVQRTGLDHSLVSPLEGSTRDPTSTNKVEASIFLIDATRKWPYPPISLPAKPYMEKALSLWRELGLPPLSELRKPWFGHTLGYWTEELEKEADLAVKGEHYLSGEKWSRRRKKA